MPWCTPWSRAASLALLACVLALPSTAAAGASTLQERLADADSVVREAALEEFSSLDVETQTDSVDAVVRRLADAHVDVRRAAVEALASCNQLEGSMVHAAAIHALLLDPDAGVRETVVWALGSMGRGVAGTHAQSIVDMLGDANEFVRKSAADALGKLDAGRQSEHALQIVSKFAHADPGVRRSAVQAITGMTALHAAHARAVSVLLDDADIEVRKATMLVMHGMELEVLMEHAGQIVLGLPHGDMNMGPVFRDFLNTDETRSLDAGARSERAASDGLSEGERAYAHLRKVAIAALPVIRFDVQSKLANAMALRLGHHDWRVRHASLKYLIAMRPDLQGNFKAKILSLKDYDPNDDVRTAAMAAFDNIIFDEL